MKNEKWRIQHLNLNTLNWIENEKPHQKTIHFKCEWKGKKLLYVIIILTRTTFNTLLFHLTILLTFYFSRLVEKKNLWKALTVANKLWKLKYFCWNVSNVISTFLKEMSWKKCEKYHISNDWLRHYHVNGLFVWWFCAASFTACIKCLR